MSIQIPTRERNAATKTKLTRQERLDLLQMAQMPGYRTLLLLMEMKCALQDGELMGADPADEKRVLAEHRIAQAKWAFFAEVQNQVAHEVNEALADDTGEMTEEQAEQERLNKILDPCYQERSRE